jgi:CRP-like cAMP-binding protein
MQNGALPLERSELFTGLPRRAILDIARQSQLRSLKKGSFAFLQGAPARHAHVVIEGAMKIVQSGPGGEQLLIRLIGPGETFGTIALFTDGRYPADAIAKLDSVEARWTAPALRAIMTKYPTVSSNVIRVLGARLQEVQRRLREIGTEPAEARMAKVLLRMAKVQRQDEDQARVILLLSRRDVAELAGTTIYTASRILAEWERRSILRSSRGCLTIVDATGLAKIGSAERARRIGVATGNSDAPAKIS